MAQPLKLLLVEDSQNDADLILLSLKRSGYEITSTRVDTAIDLKTALAKEDWDIIISDYTMPGFSGLQALSIVKETGLDLPFILVSGIEGEETAVAVMKAGASDYIMKNKLMRLAPAVERELREAANRIKLREKEAQLLQSQKMEVVGQLAGGVAHDFNNVLAVILLNCDALLEKTHPGDMIYDHVDQIRMSGEQAANLTRQLLAFSRKQILDPKILDLNATIVNMEKLLRRLIGEHIRLNIHLGSALGTIRIDPGQLEQVIMNLAVNSRDAMPKGGCISITTEFQKIGETVAQPEKIPTGEYIVMSVIDNGCGMDSDTIAHIFEPFFTTKAPNKGTGLGLSTVYGILKQSKSFISVESQLEQGSTFKVYFPQIDLSPHVLDATTNVKSSPSHQATVLLVEDQEKLRNIMAQVLTKGGYKVLQPSSLDETTALIEQQGETIDLLVTDVVMPYMNGPELARLLIQKKSTVKIIFISGYLNDTLEQFKLNGKQKTFLQKPFSSQALLKKVEDILSHNP